MPGARLVAGLVALSFCTYGRPILAQGAPERARIAVLPIEFDGEPGPGAAQRMQEELQAGLARGEFELIGGAQITAAIPGDGCGDAACYQAVAAVTSTGYVVHAAVTVRSRDYRVDLELVDGKNGSVVASSDKTCEICGLDEVGDVISAGAAVLVAQLESLAAGPPVLLVSSSPPGARVFVDGEAAGKTPFEGELGAGKHVVRVSRPGYVSVEREISLVEGVRASAEFELEPVPMADSLVRKSARPWGWLALGTGLAAFGGGVGLLAIDDRPNKRKDKCSGDNVDPQGDCKFLYNTHWAGASLAVVGAVAATVGVAILIGTRSRGGAPSTARALITPTGVTVQKRF